MYLLQNQAFPMRYAKNMAKPYAFAALQKQIQACTKCKGCKKCHNEPTLWGNPNATLLIMLAWPNSNYDEITYLESAFSYYNVDKDILAFAYTAHCCGYLEGPPYREEIEICAEYTRSAIDIIEPLAILCLSTFSSNLFYKQSLSDSIKEPSFIQNIPIFTTYPPSYILNLRDNNNDLYNSKHQDFYLNIKRALDYLEQKYPELVIYKEE